MSGGRIFFIFDGTSKLMKVQPVLDTTAQLGYPVSSIAVMAAPARLHRPYVIPLTRVLGAILLTGYLGGAVSAHLRVGNPPFEMFFPVIMGAMVWAGIFVRDARVRALVISRSI